VALQIGARLGPYEIQSAIGAGGMGEVYRARDTKLQREVAIKVLPEALAHDPERLARFEREARTLASLNHPNIAQIYGLEESAGTAALVLELVEGPTLADRIAERPIPLDEALPIAKQIAEALEAAHEHGIIHRDLKPANIKVRPDGAVKVLDFGLAKALEPTRSATDVSQSQSPTITSPAMMTGVGVLLGTAAYMSPEQAKGRAADKRSDVWAYGCVLYEMLSGKRAFKGEDVGDTLATVLKGEPEWTALPGEVSPRTVTLIRRCLQKDIKKRTRDAGDIVLELDEALSAPATPAAATATGAPILSRRSLVVGLAGLLLGGFISGLAVWPQQKPAPTLPVSRFPMALPPGQRLAGLNLTAIALSPDGRRFAYVAASATGPQQLYVQEMDSLEGKPIAGTEGAVSPFFSPDGQSLGFFTFDWLKRVSISGGPPVPLAAVNNLGVAEAGGKMGPLFSLTVLTVGFRWFPTLEAQFNLSPKWIAKRPRCNIGFRIICRAAKPCSSPSEPVAVAVGTTPGSKSCNLTRAKGRC
jgi:serine/threonine protein kinase